ncbi:MAG: histidine kinase [Clostridia bacterium]|nr:histidine kinase [Clostridia bacterium]
MEDRTVINRQALYDWFWYRPLFRRLRHRIMTMLLVLVLPVSLICIVISIVSAVQGSQLAYLVGNNGLSAYGEKVVLQCRYENIDLTADFPASFARKISGLLSVVSPNGGSLYVSLDGQTAYQVLTQEGETGAAEDYRKLLQTRNRYFWQDPDSGLSVLVTFPYSFALRSLPVWFWIAQIIAFITLLLCPFLYKRLQKDVLDPIETLNTATRAFGEDRNYRIPEQGDRVSDDYLSLFHGFNDMADEVQASYDKDVRILETEMENLRLQVNPHMLLNSYNMIYALAQSKNYEVIQDYTLCLTDYFRYVLRRGQKLVTVRQELEFVDNFIRIQRIRFPGRFSYVYQAEESCMDALIPPLLIENFVENAIKYALEPREAIEIVVSVQKDRNKNGREVLHIAITDTGSGIRPEVLEKLQAGEPYVDAAGHKHIGIYNCMRRIELFYGEEGDVHFSSGEGLGTQIYLVVPFMTADEGETKEAQT